jgi:hypothetical protein
LNTLDFSPLSERREEGEEWGKGTYGRGKNTEAFYLEGTIGEDWCFPWNYVFPRGASGSFFSGQGQCPQALKYSQ